MLYSITVQCSEKVAWYSAKIYRSMSCSFFFFCYVVLSLSIHQPCSFMQTFWYVAADVLLYWISRVQTIYELILP